MMKRAWTKPPPSLYTYLWDTWTLQSDEDDVVIDWDRVVAQVKRKPRIAKHHDEERRGMLLLHLACALHPTLEVISVLLDANPDATAHKSGTGLIPLHIAAGRNASNAVLRLLLQHDPGSIHGQDRNSQTAIHYACRQDVNHEVVHLLLQFQPTVVGGGQQCVSSGSKALQTYAARRSEITSPLDILCKESGPAARDGYGRWTENQWLKIIKLVLVAHYGKLPSARTSQKQSFLHAALAGNCPLEVLEIAVRKYGKQTAGTTDLVGNLPLHYALGCSSLMSSPTIASKKRKNNVDENGNDDEQDPADVLSTLLSCYPHAAGIRDAKGRLPLHQALKKQQSQSRRISNRRIQTLLKLYPLAVQLQDQETKLLPALLAARGGSVETTFLLLREYPQIIVPSNL